MRLLLSLLLILALPAYSEDTKKKKPEAIVNKHLSSEARKKEIKQKRTSLETRKNAKVVPPPAQPKKDPSESKGVILEQETNAAVNEKPVEVFKPLRDPGSEIQSEVSEERQEYSASEYEKAQMIQKIKREAEKSGYKVNVIDN